MTRRVVVFDLDGTLVDTAPDVLRALNRTLSGLGRPPHTVEDVRRYLGDNAHILESAFAATGGVPSASELTALRQAYLEDYAANPLTASTLFPDVFEALGTMRRRGYRLAVCTNKPSMTALPVLEASGLAPWFDAVVCGDQVGNRKPHADHVHAAIAAAGGDASSPAMFVGDTHVDIQAARNAAIPAVAVTFGYGPDVVGDIGADAIVAGFGELADAVDELFAKTGC